MLDEYGYRRILRLQIVRQAIAGSHKRSFLHSRVMVYGQSYKITYRLCIMPDNFMLSSVGLAYLIKFEFGFDLFHPFGDALVV